MGEIALDAHDVTTLASLARDCAEIGAWMANNASLDDRLAGSVPYLTMCAVAVAGWQLLRQARAAKGTEVPAAIAQSKPVVARFFLEHVVPEAAGLRAAALGGADILYTLGAEALTQ